MVYSNTIQFLLSGVSKVMHIVIDENDKRPVYVQVGDEIKLLIASGVLREGTPLPPVRQLAGDLGVNLNTIATAYRELQDVGLITIRHGSGAVVASNRSANSTEEELRKPLRTALTHFTLAGFKRAEIMNIVSDELRGLLPKKN